MTLELTLAGTPVSEDEFRCKGKAGTNKMVYRINEHQLLRVWSVISSFSRIREIDDPLAQSEILTNAQMLFTAFVFDLRQWMRIKPQREPASTRSCRLPLRGRTRDGKPNYRLNLA